MADILDIEANHHADLDILVESQQEAIHARIGELYRDPDEREQGLFVALGADVDLVIEDFEETEIEERDEEWLSLFAAMVVASRMQAFYEAVGTDVLELSEKAGQAISAAAKGMSKAQLTEAAKKGIGKGNIAAAKEKKLEASNG